MTALRPDLAEFVDDYMAIEPLCVTKINRRQIALDIAEAYLDAYGTAEEVESLDLASYQLAEQIGYYLPVSS